jgi:hypothetical protein
MFCIVVTFMQSIYNYIHETNHVNMVYLAAAVLCLKFVINVMLFAMINILHFYISIFQTMGAVSNMSVFCSSLISCFPFVFLGYFLNDFEVVLVTHIITGIIVVSTSCALCSYCNVFII